MFSSNSCNVTVIESVSTAVFGILYLIELSEVLAVYRNVKGSPELI